VNFSPLAIGLHWVRPRLEMLLSVYGIDVWRRLSAMQLIGMKRIDRILSISAATRDQMILYNELDRKRFDILPCTLDPFYGRDADRTPRKELSLPTGGMILCVARLDPSERYKGIDRLIESLPSVLKKIPHAVLVVVGDGRDRARLEGLAEQEGVHDKVIFAGRVEENDLPEYYQACDLFAMPSLKEGFGIVFLEAMHYARPCIGARAGGIPEVIENGKTGFLIEPGDAKTLSGSLIHLLRDETSRREMGEKGRERFEREFSFGRFRGRLESIVGSVGS
jgi:glycosyltransferase involved in cell wall biosynthesis